MRQLHVCPQGPSEILSPFLVARACHSGLQILFRLPYKRVEVSDDPRNDQQDCGEHDGDKEADGGE